MTTDTRCQNCGKTVTADALMGLCPDCLLKAGVATGSEAVGQGVGDKFVPPTPAELARFFPQLEILELIGRGGMGAVYKARQRQLDRFVAVKILPPGISHDPAFADRFAREAKALAKLNHPNIVTLYEFGQMDGLFFFLMEFVDGMNLRQLLHAGRIAPREALAIVPQICDALQYAHDAGIVHRDIKPENILLDRQGRVKVADFGLAKLAGRESGEGDATGSVAVCPELTEAGKVMGTPQYMAPEQTEHPSEVDHRADIYSLGVVFYQMLTGELPAGRNFAPPSTRVVVDVRLDEVVLRALERQPERRYQQVSEVKTMVETIVTTPLEGRAPSRPEPASRSTDGAAPTTAPIGKADQPPRFSRMAIVGAVWAPMCFAAVLFFVASPAAPVGEHHGPAWWQILFEILLMCMTPLGFTAPFGTTILGCVALSQIRRSGGKLYGLGLALFDALLFPLLALDALIGGVWLFALRLYADFYPIGAHPIAFALLPTLATVAVTNFLIIRAAWRAANKPLNGTPGQPPLSGDHAMPDGRRNHWLATAIKRLWGSERTRDMNDTARSKVGAISLWASIIGIVIPPALFALDTKWIICLLLFAGLELVAVVTGLIGRRTPTGKAGLIISLVCIVLTVLTGGAAFLFSGSPSTPPEEIPIVQTVRSQDPAIADEPRRSDATSHPDAETAAVVAASNWLALVDGEQYVESWDEAAQFFKGAVTREQWIQTMQGGRKFLGKNLSRKLESRDYRTSLPGAPDGEYVMIQFKASFENKASAVETITPMLDKDGKWRVSGYYMK